jgi:hypothetical protein
MKKEYWIAILLVLNTAFAGCIYYVTYSQNKTNGDQLQLISDKLSIAHSYLYNASAEWDFALVHTAKGDTTEARRTRDHAVWYQNRAKGKIFEAECLLSTLK